MNSQGIIYVIISAGGGVLSKQYSARFLVDFGACNTIVKDRPGLLTWSFRSLFFLGGALSRKTSKFTKKFCPYQTHP